MEKKSNKIVGLWACSMPGKEEPYVRYWVNVARQNNTAGKTYHPGMASLYRVLRVTMKPEDTDNSALFTGRRFRETEEARSKQ